MCNDFFRFSGPLFGSGVGEGTVLLLATDALGPDPQAQTDTGGNNAVHIRLPLPEDMRAAYSLSKGSKNSIWL